MCVTVAHLVGELSCDDAILDEQHDGVVCDDSHQEEKHNPREKPSLLQSWRNACSVSVWGEAYRFLMHSGDELYG